MDTPRRDLVRATEDAIEEYIQVGCVENLRMIRQLEDAAFRVWVESNTSFLNETVATIEDEDGWIWDEDYLYQSVCANLDDNEVSVADNNSSICSSIKPCDETDCSLGYLASCEDDGEVHEYMDVRESLEEEFVTDFRDAFVKDSTDVNTDIRMYENGRLGSVLKEQEILNIVHEIPFNQDEDEWVIVNTDLPESLPNNDWFIVSISETSQCNLQKQNQWKSTVTSSVDECIKQPQTYKNGNRDIEDDNDESDLTDWAVLSMRVTERKDNSVDQTVKQILPTELRGENDLVCEIETHHRKHDSHMQYMKETFGVTTEVSSGISGVDRCPLCNSRQKNYKCAIFCLLME